MKRFESRVDPATGERYLAVFGRGTAVTDDSILNKGTCFTEAERDALGLAGLLPPAVQTVDEQMARAYDNFRQAGDDVQKYLFLVGLQDRNEILFTRLVLAHLEEMTPIIYTPTVGKACEQYSHIYRRARGVYIAQAARGRIIELLRNADTDDPRLIVITDNEAILGIGDQGVGGMPIAVGKLALYSVGAGIHPAQCLPIDLDVGTDNQTLLADPLYLGVRRRRMRGAAYFELLDELVDAIATVFPRALVQWEDLANTNAFAVLSRYRRRLLTFNDDIQGTGATVVAGIRSALRQAGRALQDERIVFFGAGASGAGSAMAVRRALATAGVPQSELGDRVICLDSKGLILSNRPQLDPVKRDLAADPALVGGWPHQSNGTLSLADVVTGFKPTVLVGASGQPGTFTESMVRGMTAHCARPIVLVLSNPTNKSEATPDDLLRWSDGQAIVGTGSPFPSVEYRGRTYTIGQGNNALVFPGIGLGAIAVDARWLPDEAFDAAAEALFESTADSRAAGDPIYPPLRELRSVSRRVAIAVGEALVMAGAAPKLSRAAIESRVDEAMWDPRENVPYRAASLPHPSFAIS